MKLPKLSEITLARNAAERETRQRAELARLMGEDGPRWGYEPLTRLIPDVFSLCFPLAGPSKPTPFHVIERTLTQKCTHQKQRMCLISAAETLHKFVRREGITGRYQQFGKMHMGRAAGEVVYWAPMVLNVEGRPTVIFVDPRRSGRLSESGIRFVLSMMNEHVRINDPDYVSVRLAVLQVDYGKGRAAEPFFNFDDNVPLFSLSELQSMVDRTYAIWDDLRRGQQTAALTGTGP